MATRWAVASGNWSSTSTWNGGTLPTSSDDVYANTFTVTIDQNVTALSLRNASTTGVTVGGGFTMSGGYTLTLTAAAALVSGGSGASTVLTLTNASGTTVTIFASWSSANATGNNVIVACNGTGAVNITGNITSANANGHGMFISGSAVTVTGNLIGNAFANAVRVNSGSLTVTGNVTNTGTQETLLVGAGAATVTGAVSGATGSTSAGIVCNNASGTLTVNGTLTALAGVAINATAAATATLTGPFISSSTGLFPVNSVGPVKLSPISNNEIRFAHVTSGTTSLYSSDVNSGAPAASNVRYGTTYAGGILTGTMRVPSPAYVAQGVETDATVGTMNVSSPTTADITAAVWNTATSSLTTSGSIGERLKNASTVDTTGSQLAAVGAV